MAKIAFVLAAQINLAIFHIEEGREYSDPKTLFYKDCSLGSVKTRLTTYAKNIKKNYKAPFTHMKRE